MAIDSKHPLYQEFDEDWKLMRDSHAGERKVKEAREVYLPSTSGMKADGMTTNQKGWNDYNAYLLRAHFPDIVHDAVEAMIGIMHHKPPVIELPAKLEDMRLKATLQGESLEMLLQRINEEQLVSGRMGLLLDVEQGVNVPYVAMYNSEKIFNWDDGKRGEPLKQVLNFVSLNESEFERDADFDWELKEKFRILILGDPQDNEKSASGSIYRVGEFSTKDGTGAISLDLVARRPK